MPRQTTKKAKSDAVAASAVTMYVEWLARLNNTTPDFTATLTVLAETTVAFDNNTVDGRVIVLTLADDEGGPTRLIAYASAFDDEWTIEGLTIYGDGGPFMFYQADKGFLLPA